MELPALDDDAESDEEAEWRACRVVAADGYEDDLVDEEDEIPLSGFFDARIPDGPPISADGSSLYADASFAGATDEILLQTSDVEEPGLFGDADGVLDIDLTMAFQYALVCPPGTSSYPLGSSETDRLLFTESEDEESRLYESELRLGQKELAVEETKSHDENINFHETKRSGEGPPSEPQPKRHFEETKHSGEDSPAEPQAKRQCIQLDCVSPASFMSSSIAFVASLRNDPVTVRPRQAEQEQDEERKDEHGGDHGVERGMLFLKDMTLPPQVNRGRQKTTRQDGRSTTTKQNGRSTRTARRQSGTVNTTSRGKKCPIDVYKHNTMTTYSVPAQASQFQEDLPRLLTEPTATRRQVTVVFENYIPRELDQANFIVLLSVLDRLQAAVEMKRAADGAPPLNTSAGVLEDIWPPQYWAKLGNLKRFPEELLHEFRAFYDLEHKLAVYSADMKWVEGDWKVPDSPQPVPFLQQDADEIESDAGVLVSTNMRASILHAYNSHVLGTTLTVPDRHPRQTQSTGIPLLDLIGRVAYDNKLNDSVVNFSLLLLASRYKDVVVISSLAMDTIRVPADELNSTRVVCFPLHVKKLQHWCILFVVRDDDEWRLWGYDPLQSSECQAFMEGKWQTWCSIVMEAWNRRDKKRAQYRGADVIDVTGPAQVIQDVGFGDLILHFDDRPTQPDPFSCGLFCIAKADDVMTCRRDLNVSGKITGYTVSLMRLRLLWLLLCKSTPVVDAEKQKQAQEYRVRFAEFTR